MGNQIWYPQSVKYMQEMKSNTIMTGSKIYREKAGRDEVNWVYSGAGETFHDMLWSLDFDRKWSNTEEFV